MFIKTAALKFIRFYQKTQIFHIEIFKRLFMSDTVCRFHPRCSDYTYQAIEKYGVIKGSGMGFKRILRCNPWNKGGYDPVK